MTISTLQSYIGQANISDGIDESTLKKMAERVIQQADDDLASMGDWIEYVEKGMEVAKQELEGRSEPWDGATNFKSTILIEASLAFGDRVTTEVLRQRNLVKTDIIGNPSDPELKKLKEERGKRVATLMNYQINYEDKTWRDKQERLFYELPNFGTVFKKTYFDPTLGKNRSVKLHYPNWAVNIATEDMHTCRSFTEYCDFSMNQVAELVAMEVWVDPFSEQEIKTTENTVEGLQKGSNTSEEVEQAIDNPERYLEQRTYFDLDGDGYEEPYIITVHEQTRKVVRVVARFDEGSMRVKKPNGRVATLANCIAEAITSEEELNMQSLKLIAIEPLNDITKYPFIPSTDGTFLDLGFYHLLTAVSMTVNSTTNILVDAGVLANLQGGLMSKGVRKKMGDIRVKAGVYRSTEIDAADLQTGIRDWNFKEPSPTLLALREQLDGMARRMIATVDSTAIQSNTPATTTLAIVQEQLLPVTSILMRVMRAMGDEFKIMYDLNGQYLDNDMYQEIVDDEEADFEVDFSEMGLDIQPTANPQMSSKFQRIQQSIAALEQLPLVMQAGGNPIPIVKQYFEDIGVDYTDDIFPPVDPEQEEQKAADMRAMQMAPIEIAKAEMQVMAAEVARNNSRNRAELVEIASKVLMNITKATLNLEQAETEQVKNQISLYTDNLEGLIGQLTNQVGIEDAVNRENEGILLGGAVTTALNAGNAQPLAQQPSNPGAIPITGR